MRNPLMKRIPRELKQDFGKYFVIFAFMIMLIGLVSGFLVASNSMMVAYDNGLDDYKVENGHFALDHKPDEDLLEQLAKKADINIYDLSYINVTDQKNKKYRLYKKRTQVNLECIMSGKLPEEKNEIAIDRLFAENNELVIGDTVKLNGKKFKITGMVALPDYSCLYEKNTDMMFNATNFTIAIVAEDGFDQYNQGLITYNYAWRYKKNIDRNDDKLNSEMSEDVMDAFKDVITDYDEGIADEAIKAGKLVLLSEILEEMEPELEAMGMSLEMFDNEEGQEQLLAQITDALNQEGVDLSEEFQTDEEVTLTKDDVEQAMNASEQEVQDAKDYLDTVEDQIIMINDYVPQYQNSAINFARNDIGGDSAMFLIFGYLVTVVLAFVFGVTISNTITAEAGVIGTLRASGYTKGELIRHYMILPVLVTLIAAVVGNVLGYTYLKNMMSDLYYHSYSLATYKTLWNSEAFLKTTVVPVLLMFVVNFMVLASKMKLSPIRFLRRDLSKRGKKKAFPLNTKIPFMHRFRIRVIFQNVANYLTLFFGIFLGGVITIFGFMFAPMLEDYKDMMLEQRICDYQYIVTDTSVKTENDQAEKFAMTSLKTTDNRYVEDEVSVFGVSEDSRYIDIKLPKDGVVLTSAFQKKFGYEVGDEIELKDSYSDKKYTFQITEFCDMDSALDVFVTRENYNKTFNKKSDYFTGYFSNEELTDLDEDEIAMVIRIEDLTKTSDQLLDSMGGFMDLIMYFGIILFLLLMYLLSKQIIEKNAQSISMTKILGFYDGEIGGIYIVATSLVVILSLLITCPLTGVALRIIFEKYLYTAVTGYIPYMISPVCYIKMIGIGVGCYAFVAFLQMKKIGKISKVEALKNAE